MRGNTFRAKIAMRIDHAESKRDLEVQVWTQGNDKAAIKILAPARDKNKGNLRLEMNLWQYLPEAERVIKIPPSLMLQSWMGSDFSNDDLVRASSLKKDYDQTIVKTETIKGEKATQLALTPKPNAPVVWGKVILWLRTADAVMLKQEFYNERGALLKTLEGSEIRKFGSHTIPTVFTMANVKKGGNKTVMQYSEVVFDQPISESHFTQEFLRKPIGLSKE